MTETTSQPSSSGTKWWTPLFHKKRKLKAITILAECNSRLTSMIEDQTRLISSLTFDNGRNERTIREYEEKISKLSNDIGILEDSIRRLQDSTANQRDKLRNQRNDIQTLNGENQQLTLGKEALKQDNVNLQRQINKWEQEQEKQTVRYEKLQKEIESLRQCNYDLKDDLTDARRTLHEKTAQSKMLSKDCQIIQNKLDEEKKKREDIEQGIDDFQSSLFVVTAAKSKMENEMGAINELLKYQVVTLRKILARKKKKEQKLEKEKQLILQYYRAKESGYTPTDTEQLQDAVTWLNNTIHVTGDNYVETNQNEEYYSPKHTKDENSYMDGVQNDVMCLCKTKLVEVGDAEFHQNEIYALEAKLYRRSKLIEELSDIIRETKPDFNVDDSPELKHYLDDDSIVSTQFNNENNENHQTRQEDMIGLILHSEESLSESDGSTENLDDGIDLNISDLFNETQSRVEHTSGLAANLTLYTSTHGSLQF